MRVDSGDGSTGEEGSGFKSGWTSVQPDLGNLQSPHKGQPLKTFRIFSRLALPLWAAILVALVAATAHAQTRNIDVLGASDGGYGPIARLGDHHIIVGAGNNLRIFDVSTIERPIPLGQLTFPDVLYSIETSGTLAYVTQRQGGFSIIDVSDAAEPVRLGRLQMPGDTAISLALSGSLVFVACGYAGVRIVDVGNPAEPRIIGKIPVVHPYGMVTSVAVSGGFAYVAEFLGYSSVFDVSDPAAPKLRGRLTDNLTARSIVVSHGVACLMGSGNRLFLVDVSNPDTPVLLRQCYGPGSSNFWKSMTIEWPYLTAWGDYSPTAMVTYDLSDASNPVQGSRMTFLNACMDACVVGERLYVTLGQGGLATFDRRDPLRPVTLGSCALPWMRRAKIAVADGFVYMTSGSDTYTTEPSRFQVVDVRNPNRGIPRGSFETPAWLWSVSAADGVAVVYHYEQNRSSVLAVDVTNPDAPEPAALIETTSTRILPLATSGRKAFVAQVWDYPTYSSSLQTFDLANPREPAFLSTLDGFPEIGALASSNGLVYAAGYSKGFSVVDVSDAANPFVRASLPSMSGGADSISISGNLAVTNNSNRNPPCRTIDISNSDNPIAGGLFGTEVSGDAAVCGPWSITAAKPWYLSGRVQVFDLRNPDAPVQSDTVSLPGAAALAVGAGDGAAFVACGGPNCADYRLERMDIGPNGKLWQRGVASTATSARCVAVTGSLALVRGGNLELNVLDITDPESQRTLGSCAMPDKTVDIALDGTLAYAATGGAGLRIVDFSDPARPRLRGSYDTTGTANRVALSGKLAYVADGAAGLGIIDVANPDAPRVRGWAYLPGSTSGVALSGTLVLAATGKAGLAILDVAHPEAPTLVAQCATATATHDVALSGSLALVTCGDGWASSSSYYQYTGFMTIDVGNPASPFLVGQRWDQAAFSRIAAVAGNLAYVLRDDFSGVGGLRIVDFSNPRFPVSRGVRESYPVSDAQTALCESGVALSGSTAYFACSGNALTALRYTGDAWEQWNRDWFTTGSIAADGAAKGWGALGFNSPLARPGFDPVAFAYRANVSAAPARYRSTGVMNLRANWMPCAQAGGNRIVRGKFRVYAGGQANPADANEIPNLRLRLSNRFAVNSMLEVFHHTGDAQQQAAMEGELRPSTDPTRPSLYRVDLDMVDVPYLADNATTEGVAQGFEAYAIHPQDNGYLALADVEVGLYPRTLVPGSAEPAKVYAPDAAGAGDLATFAPAEMELSTLVAGVAEGEYARRDFAAPLPLCTEGPQGVTLDATPVPSDRIGVATRHFNPDRATNAFASRVRVEPGRQYHVRWHLTSTQQTNRQAQVRLRARSVKFGWSQKLEIGGAWATDGGQTYPLNANNAIAQQALPGVGCRNPDQMVPGEPGGWYSMVVQTPLCPDIRPEFPLATPIEARMPNLAAQPGPGANAFSRRDLLLGMDLIDTLSAGAGRFLEQGNVTLDRVEVRVFGFVQD